jgi:hypothetical protein
MNNLSTAASTDISSQIGALESGDHLASHDDGALEAAANPTPMTRNLSCPTMLSCPH